MTRPARPPRFDARWQDRRSRARRWRRRGPIGGIALLALVLGASLLVTRWSARQGPWETLPARIGVCGSAASWQACAIDGDTLSIAAPGGVRRRVRLTGYDAPEIDGGCLAERQLAVRARAELALWLSERPARVDGGADPPRDRYGRELRRARRIDGNGRSEWLDDHMVAAGLARRDGPGVAAGWCGG
ncbi:hypothetical protein A6F68_00687 [Tsuneonella dongtanensis]|uniref:TNase-like domain-containing protein n=1 Tax=Tsuneonella dongtanensis TaxID=692370 RepID=A0A1B2AAP9_9SPHN|nr:hypothetical protein [Tsuneonella dongtanensis]ANY19216.1 hypothetical protein A6F68_00687 [Tsuneonella dongtanensis]